MRLWAIALLACHCGAPCARVASGVPERCERLACPTGARPTAKGDCACDDGLSVLGGACVPPSDKSALCGPASFPSEGGCAPKPCPTGVIDGVTGVCLPVGSVRALGESFQMTLLPDETLECASSFRLVAGGNSAACIPADKACGPGASMIEKKCAPVRACPSGEVAIGGACERIVHASDGGPVVDVATWTRAMLGPDGGAGSSFVCGAFQSAPWTFTSSTDVRLGLQLAIDLRIPDNDVTQARARVEATSETGQPTTVDAVQRQVDRLVSALRALGGTSRASAVSTRIQCDLPVGGRPMPVPLPR